MPSLDVLDLLPDALELFLYSDDVGEDDRIACFAAGSVRFPDHFLEQESQSFSNRLSFGLSNRLAERTDVSMEALDLLGDIQAVGENGDFSSKPLRIDVHSCRQLPHGLLQSRCVLSQTYRRAIGNSGDAVIYKCDALGEYTNEPRSLSATHQPKRVHRSVHHS